MKFKYYKAIGERAEEVKQKIKSEQEKCFSKRRDLMKKYNAEGLLIRGNVLSLLHTSINSIVMMMRSNSLPVMKALKNIQRKNATPTSQTADIRKAKSFMKI